MPSSAKHDLFISYAWSDTLWVQAFRDRLQEVLETRREMTGIDIWLDTEDMRGRSELSSGIRDAVKSSAALVVVLSEGYLDSHWCVVEREIFIEHCCGGNPSNDRIFPVRIDPITPDRYPDELRTLIGFDFFEEEPKTRVVRPAALVDEQKGIYFPQFYRLRNELVDALTEVRSPVISSAGRQEPVDQTPPVEGGSAAPIADTTMPAQGAGKVFLADDFPVPEFQKVRAEVEVALKGQGIEVLPSGTYWNAPQGFEEDVEEQLRASNLFVQLLSAESAGLKHDAFPDGYAAWLLDMAVAVARVPAEGVQPLPLFRWRSREFPLPDDSSSFLTAHDVRQCDLSEFIPMIGAELAKQLTRQAHDLNTEARQVVVCQADPDRAQADDIGGQIERLSLKDTNARPVEVQVLHPAAGLSDVEAIRPGAMLVVTDKAAAGDVTDRLRLCRRAALSNRHRPPPCLLMVPNPDQFFLPATPPSFQLARRDDQNVLRELISSLHNGGDAA